MTAWLSRTRGPRGTRMWVYTALAWRQLRSPHALQVFLFHIIEKRLWAYGDWEHKWPPAFAGTCSPVPGTAVAASDRSRDFWEVSCLAESAANVLPGLHALRRKVYWVEWPINQLHFRFFAHCDFQVPPIRNFHSFSQSG